MEVVGGVADAAGVLAEVGVTTAALAEVFLSQSLAKWPVLPQYKQDPVSIRRWRSASVSFPWSVRCSLFLLVGVVVAGVVLAAVGALGVVEDDLLVAGGLAEVLTESWLLPFGLSLLAEGFWALRDRLSSKSAQ